MQTKKIEDIFNEVLSGEVLKNALGFMKFLNENGIIQANQHSMHYKNKCVCYIDVFNDIPSWAVWTAGDYNREREDFPIDEPTKKIAWSHANKCGNCDGMVCNPGKAKTIFGKEFGNICNGADVDMVFDNPNGEALNALKKLVKMKMYIIDNG